MKKKLKYNKDTNTYYGGTPFSITVTSRPKYRKQPYRWVSARTKQLSLADASKAVDAAVGPLLHWMQPSQYVGAVRDAVNGKNPLTSMFRGNSGVVSEEYAAEHPILSTVFNLGTDAAIPTALWAKNTTPVRNYRLSRATNNAVKNTNSIEERIAKVPLTEGYMYHSHRDYYPGIVRNGKHYNLEYSPGALHVEDGKYASSRIRTINADDRIWWDTNGHNVGDNVYVTREGGMTLDNPNSRVLPMHGLYEKSYRTTYRPNTSDVVRFKYDGIGNTYVPYSPYRQMTTNKMSVEELFTPDNFITNKQPSTIDWLDAKSVTPKITADNATSIIPEQWTAAQDAAIARGDMAEAQRLRDLHFEVKTPGNKIKTKLYHGTDSKPWYKFDINKFGSATDGGFYGKGLYLTKFPNMTKFYGKNRMNFYIYSKTPLKANFDPNVEIKPSIEYKASYYFNRPEETPFKNKENIFKILKNKDAVSIADETEVVIANGRNIKSADAVTYDNNGVRIPLGIRDNFKINDIRYSWLLPTIGLGVGAKAMNNK